MNVMVHLVIQDLVSQLHSGKIDPHGEDLAMQILECFKPHIIFKDYSLREAAFCGWCGKSISGLTDLESMAHRCICPKRPNA